MVVSGVQVNGVYFTSELDGIRIQEVANHPLTVSIHIDKVTILKEVYTPVDGVVTLYDVGELIFQHMRVELAEIGTSYAASPVEVTLMLNDQSSMMAIPFKVFYSRQQVNYFELEHRFLTEEAVRKTVADRNEYVTYILHEKTEVEYWLAYLQEGVERYAKVVTVSTTNKINMLSSDSFTLAQWAKKLKINTEQVLYLDVYLKEDGALQDTLRFLNDRENYRHTTEFFYIDAFAAPASLTFHGVTERSPELLGEVVSVLGKKVRQDVRISDVRTVHTGYLQSDAYLSLLTLVTSPCIFMRDGPRWLPVIIDEIDFSHQDVRNQRINVQLTVRQAGKQHLAFNRQAQIRHRIFDKSFDATFN